MIKYIQSKSNSRIKYITSLHLTKNRKDSLQFLMEGKKNLEMAIETNRVKEVYSLLPIKDLPESIDNYIVNQEIMDKISEDKNPEGIVFLCDIVELELSNTNKLIYLDGVNDPGNAGTIIRTALAFNYDGVILSPDSVDIYNHKTLSATRGAIFKIPVFKKDLFQIKKNQIIITSTLSEKSIKLNELVNKDPFILVVGNEAHGVKQSIIDKSDFLVKIEIEHIDSLNVAIASAILMHHLK